jgi:hypothetical protein
MKDARNSTHSDAINTYTDNSVKQTRKKKRKPKNNFHFKSLLQEEKHAHMTMLVWARIADIEGGT